MSQSNQNKQNDDSSLKDKFSNQNKCNKYESVEPLPESSRPRRDGLGGEDAE